MRNYDIERTTDNRRVLKCCRSNDYHKCKLALRRNSIYSYCKIHKKVYCPPNDMPIKKKAIKNWKYYRKTQYRNILYNNNIYSYN